MTTKLGSRRLSSRQCLLLIGFVWAGFAGQAASGQLSTTPPTKEDAPAAHPAAFDVVSIKPSKPGETYWTFGDPPGEDLYRAINRPLGVTILEAYFPMALSSRQRLVGAPDWVWKENYDFVGRISAADSEEWEKLSEHWGRTAQNPLLPSMLQIALADRCKLVMHRVPAEIPGYALIVGGHGPNWTQLQETRPGETIPPEAQKIDWDGRMIPYQRGVENPTLHFYQTSSNSLAAQLSGFGAPVVDKTGLTGTYDFALMKVSAEGDPAVDWDLGALGLKLVPTKIPTEDVVIDHIERPSPN
jgi:uncharacterized protein (TIGR03435 family)